MYCKPWNVGYCACYGRGCVLLLSACSCSDECKPMNIQLWPIITLILMKTVNSIMHPHAAQTQQRKNMHEKPWQMGEQCANEDTTHVSRRTSYRPPGCISLITQALNFPRPWHRLPPLILSTRPHAVIRDTTLALGPLFVPLIPIGKNRIMQGKVSSEVGEEQNLMIPLRLKKPPLRRTAIIQGISSHSRKGGNQLH